MSSGHQMLPLLTSHACCAKNHLQSGGRTTRLYLHEGWRAPPDTIWICDIMTMLEICTATDKGGSSQAGLIHADACVSNAGRPLVCHSEEAFVKSNSTHM